MTKRNLKNPDIWDIFAEEGMVCQSLGVAECFRMDYLRESYKWVNENGCATGTRPGRIQKRVDVAIGKNLYFCLRQLEN